MSEAGGTLEGTETPQAGMGFVQRVIGVFTAPGKTFEDVANKPTVLMPLLLVMLFAGANAYIIAPISGKDQADLMSRSAFFERMIPDKETREQQLEEMRNPTTITRVLAIVQSAVGTLVFLVIFALVYWGLGNLLGGEPTFKKMLSMLAFAGMISVVAAHLVRLPLIIAKDTVFGVSLSPVVFFPDAPVTSPTFRLLSALSVFAIWSVVVTGIGFARVSNTSTRSGIVTVSISYLVLVAVGYFVSGFFL